MHKMARRQDRRKHGRGSGPGHVQQHTHLRPLTLREQRCLRTQRERGGCYRDAEERRSAAVRRHGARHSTAQHRHAAARGRAPRGPTTQGAPHGTAGRTAASRARGTRACSSRLRLTAAVAAGTGRPQWQHVLPTLK